MSDNESIEEIERKFLTKNNSWKNWSYHSIAMVQGYFDGNDCPVNFDSLNLWIGQHSIPLTDAERDVVKSIITDDGKNISPKKCSVRIRKENDKFKFTIKKRIDENSCYELEYNLPPVIGAHYLAKTNYSLEKTRYLVGLGNGLTADVDVYHGDNSEMGDTVEVEFSSRKLANSFTAPDWFGEELTGDKRYSCKCLAREPFNLR